jgi:ferredoxin
MSPAEAAYTVALEDCIRCAACTSLAPGVLEMRADGPHFVRQPANAAEQALVVAALVNCPVAAIKKAPRRGEP